MELRIAVNRNTFSFYYAVTKRIWNLLKDAVDAKFLGIEPAKGFVDCMYALYITSSRKKAAVKFILITLRVKAVKKLISDQ